MIAKWAVVLAWLVPGIAAADPEHFVTMDRQDGSSRIGLELSNVFFNDSGSYGRTGLRLDAHGQYVTPNGLGVYFSAPFGYGDNGGTGSDMLGDLEVGGVFIPPTAVSSFQLVIHGGITLPTGIGNSGGLMFWPRLTDLDQYVPGSLSVRAGVSPISRDGALFLRGDFGVDLSANLPTVVRANAAAGIDLGRAAVMVESVNLYMTGTHSMGSDGWFDNGALSVRGNGEDVYPYAALVVGLDADVREVMHEAITVGLEGKLH